MVRADRSSTLHLAALTALVIATGAVAGEARAQAAATGALIDANGATLGQVTMTELSQGVHILAEATGLPPGVHAFHIHAVGLCEPPFATAGGHANPTDAKHGWNNPDGPHAGDLPNVHVQDDGILAVEYFTAAVTLDDGDSGVFDDDGSAIVIHEGADDYESDPAGAAGPRIACAVIVAKE